MPSIHMTNSQKLCNVSFLIHILLAVPKFSTKYILSLNFLFFLLIHVPISFPHSDFQEKKQKYFLIILEPLSYFRYSLVDGTTSQVSQFPELRNLKGWLKVKFFIIPFTTWVPLINLGKCCF